jgi:Na+-translocating ferredoxin:NAD+ oxidoreductase subunit B
MLDPASPDPALPDALLARVGPRRVALIDEAACIGCTLCIAACPFDAIVGAAQRMHTVVASLCTGCELCVAPCPVDCIVMTAATAPWTERDRAAAHARYESRAVRLEAERATRADRRGTIDAQLAPIPAAADELHTVVRDAIERVRARKARAAR